MFFIDQLSRSLAQSKATFLFNVFTLNTFVNVCLCSERCGWVPGSMEVPENLHQEYRWINGLSVTEMEIMHGSYRKDNYNCEFGDFSLWKIPGPNFMALLTAEFCAYDHHSPLTCKRRISALTV